MGKLDDARKQAEEMMQQAMAQGQAQGGQYAAANIAAAQAESNAVKAEAAALDKNDPMFAPIEGVSYDEYVALAVKMQPAGTDTAKQLEIAQAVQAQVRVECQAGGMVLAASGQFLFHPVFQLARKKVRNVGAESSVRGSQESRPRAVAHEGTPLHQVDERRGDIGR